MESINTLMDDLFHETRNAYIMEGERERFLDKTTGIIHDCKKNCKETCRDFDCPRLWDLEIDEIVDHPGVIDHEIVAITHRWSTKEITYKNLTETKRINVILERLKQPLDSNKVSSLSIKLAKIREELRNQTKYVWMDTLCIDKDSSAELDMSIRSMFRWYKAAKFVYLEYFTDLKEWSTRAWTLQEGIAAKSLRISPIHGENFLEAWIKTNIPIQNLGFQEKFGHGLDTFSYLYLISKRKTTRKEDMAYCLIGLLDVNISIAYGEGNKAFIRLLTQIGLEGDISWILAFLNYTIRIWDYFVRFPILENLRDGIGSRDGTYMKISTKGIELELLRITGKHLKHLISELFPGYKLPMNKEKTEILPGHNQEGSTVFYYETWSKFVFAIYNDDCIIYGRRVSGDLASELHNISRYETVCVWHLDIWNNIHNSLFLFDRCGIKRDIANGYYTTEPLKECIENRECDICTQYADDDPRPKCLADKYFGPTACNSRAEEMRQKSVS